MTVLLVLFTLIVFLVADHFYQKSRQRASLVIEKRMDEQIPAHTALAMNHTWWRPNKDGSWTVGLDGLLSSLFGVPDMMLLPVRGESLDAGPAGITLGIAGKRLKVGIPYQSHVLEVNPDVLANPSLLVGEPYGKGWMLKVRANEEDVRRHTVTSPKPWLKEQMERIRDFLASRSPTQFAALQDGGTPVKGVLQLMDQQGLDAFSELFTGLPSSQRGEVKS
jgi:glycine cleavage system H protein